MRLGTLVASTLLALCGALAVQETAQAAPTFLLPDLTFSARGDARTVPGTSPVTFNASSFTLGVLTSIGDSMALDTGSGFVPINSTLLQVNAPGAAVGTGFAYGAGFTIQLGPGGAAGIGTSKLVLVKSLVGYDGLAFIKVTATTAGSPWTVGETLGLDLHIFNVTKVGTGSDAYYVGAVKGDLAPVVPEPASLGLLGLGLLGLATRRRRGTS